MNWTGGSRRRNKFRRSRKQIQRQFFSQQRDKKRKAETTQTSAIPIATKKFSRDLIKLGALPSRPQLQARRKKIKGDVVTKEHKHTTPNVSSTPTFRDDDHKRPAPCPTPQMRELRVDVPRHTIDSAPAEISMVTISSSKQTCRSHSHSATTTITRHRILFFDDGKDRTLEVESGSQLRDV